MSNFELSVRFFLQLAVIVVVCRAVGMLARQLGQPQVVGEMIAGIVMGPSLFGALTPDLQAWMFPKASMGILYASSQVGLVLYMFIIGMEFRVDLLRNRMRSAISVSLAGILAPFALGCLIAALFGQGDLLFGPGVSQIEAMLFTGAAMSITAFPMLARIIYERGLSGTSLGTLALAAGSIDDAAAWCVLAIVLASFSQDSWIAVLAIGGGAAYVAVALLVGRPLLQRLAPAVQRQGEISGTQLALVLALVMFSAWFTDTIGIYAVFGAFILGAAMPRGIVTEELNRTLEPITTNFLLPLFFIYSGLNTRLSLVDTPYLWGITLVVIAAACLGKGLACWLAARLSGENQRDAAGIGALMNARGLMELIILNIGLERKVITPVLFTVMVLMAVVTTLLTAPVFRRVYQEEASPLQAPVPSA